MQLCRIRLYGVNGAGRAGARRPSLSPAVAFAGLHLRPRPAATAARVCTTPWHPASGGSKLIRSARFDLVSERIAPVATVPVRHQRPFHAAVPHARATQACRSIAPRTHASADAARQPRSVPSCSSNEASRRSCQAAPEATSCTSRWANGRAAVRSSSCPSARICRANVRSRFAGLSKACELRALMRCNG